MMLHLWLIPSIFSCGGDFFAKASCLHLSFVSSLNKIAKRLSPTVQIKQVGPLDMQE